MVSLPYSVAMLGALGAGDPLILSPTAWGSGQWSSLGILVHGAVNKGGILLYSALLHLAKGTRAPYVQCLNARGIGGGGSIVPHCSFN